MGGEDGEGGKGGEYLYPMCRTYIPSHVYMEEGGGSRHTASRLADSKIREMAMDDR
jgi:hypothetical protein